MVPSAKSGCVSRQVLHGKCWVAVKEFESNCILRRSHDLLWICIRVVYVQLLNSNPGSVKVTAVSAQQYGFFLHA